MSTKKPSIVTQLKNAKAEIAEHRLHIEKLQKELDSAKSNNSYHSERAQKAEAEVGQIHAFLDSVPNPPPTAQQDNQYAKLSAMTRLSVFFATRQTIGA